MSELLCIRGYLQDNNLDAGFSLKNFRWDDRELGDNPETRFIVVRPNGGGQVDRDIGRPFFKIHIIGQKNDNPFIAYERAQLIRDVMIDNYKVGNIIQFQFFDDIIGPLYITNNRPMYEINLTALNSRG